MPELPEVESARSVIDRGGLHRTIIGVDDSDTWECRPHLPGEIRDALVGHRLTAAHRRGKSIWCDVGGDGSPTLGIHLGMSGRILVSGPGGTAEGGDYQGTGRRADPARRREEWFRFTLEFEDGGALRLLDPRRLGRVRLDPDVDALGPDAAEVGREEFRERVGRGRLPVKARLLDQSSIAGVGNLLADEVLWRARLDPRRPAGELSVEELDGLRRQVRAAVRSAIRHGGVHTLEVVAHRGPSGHCPRCGAEMRRATVGGRTTWFCPREQV
ncbi:formamidopyrimidine-DNA glycosylase [Phycicoccus sp. HDW14]|uniref:Fpg/Nei family DNA glycosylase n=1 Tax=Phycicoccus sp. HDW14 TaxID=2714941 RepID=UPI00140D0796|nr:DNA-formamidopyrimidine glycosylase family protein [Phycicoccus sp. HDW14]QIM22658.1 formamidopyrimidine-DNA glycosylase [Phycicoccus sp. HDW14]